MNSGFPDFHGPGAAGQRGGEGVGRTGALPKGAARQGVGRLIRGKIAAATPARSLGISDCDRRLPY
eukprot:4311803-Pyramimonas_sp.AAC.1